MKIDLFAGKPILPVVFWRNQLMYDHLFLDERDEWQEQITVQSVLIKRIGVSVRCRDNSDARIEQSLEQTPHDHRIGNVGDLHLVQTKQTLPLGQLIRNRLDRVLRPFLAGSVEISLDALHEGMKMNATGMRTSRDIVEQVHQH